MKNAGEPLLSRSLVSGKERQIFQILAALVAAASAAGILVDRVYALEKPIWAAQGIGQDIVNLIVAVPVLVISAHLEGKGSIRALLVRTGALCTLRFSPYRSIC